LNYIHKLPEDIIKILLQVFQTSSVADFNSTFLLLEKQHKQHAVLRRTGAPPDLLPSDIFTLAESEYRDMQTQNKWSGVHTKGKSAFHTGHPGAGQVQQLCFNCGGAHHVKQCTLPRDEGKINKEAAKFMAEVHKKQSERNNHGGGGRDKDSKWPPATSKEQNKRVIDGKPMFWMHFRKRWVPDKNHHLKTESCNYFYFLVAFLYGIRKPSKVT
jgi:hypothetical protein